MFKESCAFNKWSISIEDGALVIDFNHHPNYGRIQLYDLVEDDLENLANMFKAAHEYFKAKRVVDQIESTDKESDK